MVQGNSLYSCDKCTLDKPASRISIYCSRQCKDAARNNRIAAVLLASKVERYCLHCTVGIPQSARKDKIFCSADCNSNAHSLQRKLRTRAGQDGKPGYLRAEICERDKWICQLCLKFVDRDLEHPDPMCPSLDHIIAVASGGGSESSNLQLTHLVCNLRRRNLPVDIVLRVLSTGGSFGELTTD